MGRVGDRKGGKGKGRNKQEDDDDHYIPCSDWLVALAVKVPRCLAQLIHQVSTKRERLTPRHVPLELKRQAMEKKEVDWNTSTMPVTRRAVAKCFNRILSRSGKGF